MSGGIQQLVTTQPAPGVVGDWCDANPRYAYDAGPGGLVAGPNGLLVGRFAWTNYSQVDGDAAPAAANNFGSGPVAGFVHRDQQGLITTYLTESGLLIPAGFQVTVMASAGLWMKNNGAIIALPGYKAYASFTTGLVRFGPAGAPTVASATSSPIAAGTAATFTGALAGNVLTTGASVTNTIYPGAVLTGSGVASGTIITGQLTGPTGGAGTYTVNISQTVNAVAMTATPYVLDTTGGTVTGTIGVGSTVASAGTPTGVVVGAGVTVANAPTAGKYIVNTGGGVSASGTVTLASDVETSWIARSQGSVGDIVKASNLPGIG